MVCTGGMSTAYLPVKRIVEAVRSSSAQSKVVIGGGLVSSEPELMFGALKPDYEVLGEGEETAQELAECLQHQKDPSSVAGLGYSLPDGRFVTTPPRNPIMDLDKIPWPDFEGFEFDTYLDHLTPTSQFFFDLFDFPRVYPIITSRSCPYSCSFCFHPIGKKYRQRSLDSIMQELETMIPRYKTNLIAIYDELFSADTKRVMEFCDRISGIIKKTPWDVKWSCQMRVDKLDGSVLARMKEAGCFVVSYGFESYNADVLKSMKKHITPAQIDRAVKLTLEHHISIQGNFIFGDRAETLQTARETLDYWKANAHSGITLGHISPFPGTELYTHCVKKGIIKDKLDFIENHLLDPINMSETMSDSDYMQLHVEVATSRLQHYIVAVPSLVMKEKNGMYSVKVNCPHCNGEIQYANFGLPYKSFYRVVSYCRTCRRRFYMMSMPYLLITKILSAAITITPMAVNVKLFAILGRLRSWAIKQIVKGSLDLSKLRKIVQT
jgi:radical SAM superfamily enzyme YgiQ (UPF0313 family)